MRKLSTSMLLVIGAALCATVVVNAQECVSNGRVTFTNATCCFPATFQDRTYNDCWTYDEELYCSTSPRSTNRTTLARCRPRQNDPMEGGSSSGQSLPPNANTAFANAFPNAAQANAPTTQAALDRLGQAFEPGSMAPTPMTRTPPAAGPALAAAFDNSTAMKAAERYTIDDQRCILPITINGNTYNDCFTRPGELDTASEASGVDGQQFCYVSTNADVEPVQCAYAGYKPNNVAAPAGLCPNAVNRTTTNGNVCVFPQQNAMKRWVCDCYSLQTMEEASDDSASVRACIPVGESSPVQCTPSSSSSGTTTSAPAPTELTQPATPSSSTPSAPPAPPATNSSNAVASTSSSSSDSGSSNTGLIVGLSVGIPLGLLAIGGLVGGVWWYNKRRPLAKATSFAKWDGGNATIKGGAISSQDVNKTGAGLSEVSRYAEQL